jgi:hypothetical protein
MHSPDNIQYAMETTRVLLEPDRRIDTFGDTRFEFLLLSELMDRSGEIRVRSGEMEAMRPRILRPESMQEIELEGFGDKARERMNAVIEKWREEGKDLAFLRYGFRFKSGGVREEIVHDTMEAVRDRVLDGYDLLRRVVRNFAPELFFEGHHQLDRVEAVGPQIVDKAGVLGHLGFVDTEMLDDDLFDPLGDIAHQ